jgi:hypothetical protein
MAKLKKPVSANAGRHNQDLDNTRGRLIKGGSWKKQRVIALIPAGKTIATRIYLSHWSLIFPPNQPSYRMLCEGMEVGDAYSTAIESILSHPELSTWEYVLTLEHDNAPPPDGLLKLLKAMEEHPEYDCIGGLYFTKGAGGVAQIWGDPKDPILNFRPQPPDLNGGIVECCGTGMGFNLWRMSMFKNKKLRKPWFKTVAGKEGVGTQDLYFWGDARKHGHRCAVDCSVAVGHYDLASDMMW